VESTISWDNHRDKELNVTHVMNTSISGSPRYGEILSLISKPRYELPKKTLARISAICREVNWPLPSRQNVDRNPQYKIATSERNLRKSFRAVSCDRHMRRYTLTYFGHGSKTWEQSAEIRVQREQRRADSRDEKQCLKSEYVERCVDNLIVPLMESNHSYDR
jgi:hypothetical protein